MDRLLRARTVAAAALGLSLSLVAAGCGSSAPAGPADVSSFGQSFGSTSCQHYALCGFIGQSEVADCSARIGSIGLGTGYSLAEAVSSGRLGYDRSAAQQCLSAIPALACDASYVSPAACSQAYVPKVALGGSCKADLECVGGYCSGGEAGCAGTCQAAFAAGTSCARSGECGASSECFGGKCRALGAAGAACVSVGDCQPGLTCFLHSQTSGYGGACAARGAAGAPCSGMADVLAVYWDTCGDGLTCVLTQFLTDSAGVNYAPYGSGTCQAKVAKGATCQSADGCADGLVCQGWSTDLAAPTTTSGTCATWGDQGSACVESNADIMTGCALLGICDQASLRCQMPAPAGGSCSGAVSAGCDYGTYCDGTTCQPLVALGGSCTSGTGGNPCREGRCDATGHCSLVCM